MYHYSAWCGWGPQDRTDPWKDDCPTECVHGNGGSYSDFPPDYLSIAYQGLECDVTDYSNLNWDLI